MKTVGITEARKRFTDLLREVERGEAILITRRGVPVARLVAEPKRPSPERFREVLRELEEFREAHPLRGLRIKDLIEEGRRY